MVLVLILAVFRVFLKRDVWMFRAAAVAGAMVWGHGGGTKVFEEGRRPFRVLQTGV